MNKIDDFYRKKEIINIVKEWTKPLNVNVNDDREKLEIGFNSNIESKLTKKEKVYLLSIMRNKIEEDLSREFVKNDKSLSVALIGKLETELEELKNEIKKDFDLEEVNKN